MRFFSMAIAGLLTVTAVQAQSQTAVLQNINSDVWQIKPDGGNFVLEHKQSGAICPVSNFHGLELVSLKEYVPDGSNVSCQYKKQDNSGPTKVTLYFYTYPGIATKSEYSSAKQAILNLQKTSGLKITELRSDGNQCFKVIVPVLGAAILASYNQEDGQKDGQKDGPKASPTPIQLGISIFNWDIPATAGSPARSEKSLLSVHKVGKWIVKTRVNVPGNSADSAVDSCRYARTANLIEAKAIRRE